MVINTVIWIYYCNNNQCKLVEKTLPFLDMVHLYSTVWRDSLVALWLCRYARWDNSWRKSWTSRRWSWSPRVTSGTSSGSVSAPPTSTRQRDSRSVSSLYCESQHSPGDFLGVWNFNLWPNISCRFSLSLKFQSLTQCETVQVYWLICPCQCVFVWNSCLYYDLYGSLLLFSLSTPRRQIIWHWKLLQ